MPSDVSSCCCNPNPLVKCGRAWHTAPPATPVPSKQYCSSLKWTRENDITGIIFETFSVATEEFGEDKIVDLIPRGRDVPVTEKNKHIYVEAAMNFRATGGIRPQLGELLKGFYQVIPKDSIQGFNCEELSMLLNGTSPCIMFSPVDTPRAPKAALCVALNPLVVCPCPHAPRAF